ncbi:hypothetical protein [Stenotrophomonas sp. AB1(2024)]|uniref:hypothetical protein n=1 Tax=Stenotrophomonas sp. AB1(2024) TaxID=3132215 RepID=UPI003097538E
MKMGADNTESAGSSCDEVVPEGKLPEWKKPWTHLSRFEVTCQGRDKVRCPVYANNRQQIPVEIILEARDEDGVVVEIPTDYSSLDLRLCEYEDPESYPYRVGQALFADTDFVYDWQVQGARDGSHDVHPVDQPASQLGRAQVVRRWLYTDLVQTRKLAVRISRRGHVRIEHAKSLSGKV